MLYTTWFKKNSLFYFMLTDDYIRSTANIYSRFLNSFTKIVITSDIKQKNKE